MSAKVMGHIWDLELPHNHLIVLLAYADHASHDGTNIYPSVGLMAHKTGYSERTIQRVTRELVEGGYLIPAGNTEYGTNHYRFNFEAGVKKSPYRGGDKMTGGDIAVSPGGDKAVSPGGCHNSVTGGGVITVSPKPSLEPSLEIVKEPVVPPTPQEVDTAIYSEEQPAAAAANQTMADVIKAYQDNIGLITPMIRDSLIDAVDTYPAEWIIDAIKEAVSNNARKWKYCAAILERWKREGRTDKNGKTDAKPVVTGFDASSLANFEYNTQAYWDEWNRLSAEEDRVKAEKLARYQERLAS